MLSSHWGSFQFLWFLGIFGSILGCSVVWCLLWVFQGVRPALTYLELPSRWAARLPYLAALCPDHAPIVAPSAWSRAVTSPLAWQPVALHASISCPLPTVDCQKEPESTAEISTFRPLLPHALGQSEIHTHWRAMISCQVPARWGLSFWPAPRW